MWKNLLNDFAYINGHLLYDNDFWNQTNAQKQSSKSYKYNEERFNTLHQKKTTVAKW